MTGRLIYLVILLSPLVLLGLLLWMGWVERRLVLGLSKDQLRRMLVSAPPEDLEQFVATSWKDQLP